VKPLADKKHILNSIAVIAKKLGRAPSQAEFVAQSGISKYFVLKSFSSWTEAVRAAGLHPSALNARIDDRALLEDWGGAVRRNAGTLPRHMFRRAAKYNPCTLAKRFGGWSSVPQAFRKFARRKQQWADVVALLPAPVAKKEGAWPKQNAARSNARGQAQQKLSKDRATYGDPIHLQGFRHEPVNEHGVMVLFGMLAKDLGFVIEAVQKEFPDCEAKRQIVPGRWQRVLIEFEFESKNYRDHGHPLTGCDVIVCWRHNWPDCPKHIEALELSRAIKSLTASRD
jgi:HNH endonuclease